VNLKIPEFCRAKYTTERPSAICSNVKILETTPVGIVRAECGCKLNDANATTLNDVLKK